MFGYVYRRPHDPQLQRAMPWPTPAARTCTLSGTITSSTTQTEIRAGGKTIILTLGNTEEWVASGATFDGQRQNIINGMDSAQGELLGWDNVVKALQGVGGVVRTSDRVVTITLDAQITYTITAQETITVTVPGSALVTGNSLVASPTFVVDTAAVVTDVPNTALLSYIRWGQVAITAAGLGGVIQE